MLTEEQRTTIQHAAEKLRTVWANHTGDKESRELCHKLEAILAASAAPAEEKCETCGEQKSHIRNCTEPKCFLRNAAPAEGREAFPVFQKELHVLIASELFEFQELTGCDTSDEYRAKLDAANAAPAEGREAVDERAAFEAWCKDPASNTYARTVAWEAWQARAALATAPTKDSEAGEQIEHLDIENHRLRRAIQQMMARLADLLDEDHFGNIEGIAKAAGVSPPTAPTMSGEIVGYLVDDPNEPDIGHWFDEGKPNRDLGLRARPLTFADSTMSEAALVLVREVRDTFKRDMEGGYVTKDKQFAVELLTRALAEIKRIDRAAAKGKSDDA